MKTFVLYADYAEKFRSLSDEQLGKLFRIILDYEATGEYSLSDDFAVNLSFDIVKIDLDRNREKYKNIVERNRENGKKGGRPKTQENPNNPVGFLGTQENPKNPKNDNDNNNKNIKEKVTPTELPKRKAVYFPEDGELDRAFRDYVAMRNKIRKPLTDKAVELAKKKLSALSGGDPDLAIKILDQSTFHSWQGLFEVHDGNRGATRSRPGEISITEKWRDA